MEDLYHGTYIVVAQNMVRTYDVKQVFFGDFFRIWRLFRCNQTPSTNRNAWFTPYMLIKKWGTMPVSSLFFPFLFFLSLFLSALVIILFSPDSLLYMRALCLCLSVSVSVSASLSVFLYLYLKIDYSDANNSQDSQNLYIFGKKYLFFKI